MLYLSLLALLRPASWGRRKRTITGIIEVTRVSNSDFRFLLSLTNRRTYHLAMLYDSIEESISINCHMPPPEPLPRVLGPLSLSSACPLLALESCDPNAKAIPHAVWTAKTTPEAVYTKTTP